MHIRTMIPSVFDVNNDSLLLVEQFLSLEKYFLRIEVFRGMISKDNFPFFLGSRRGFSCFYCLMGKLCGTIVKCAAFEFFQIL